MTRRNRFEFMRFSLHPRVFVQNWFILLIAGLILVGGVGVSAWFGAYVERMMQMQLIAYAESIAFGAG